MLSKFQKWSRTTERISTPLTLVEDTEFAAADTWDPPITSESLAGFVLYATIRIMGYFSQQHQVAVS